MRVSIKTSNNLSSAQVYTLNCTKTHIVAPLQISAAAMAQKKVATKEVPELNAEETQVSYCTGIANQTLCMLPRCTETVFRAFPMNLYDCTLVRYIM